MLAGLRRSFARRLDANRRRAVALVLSCGVYLVPLVTVHWIDLFGVVLARELAAGDKVTAWKAADVALAVLLQAAIYLVAWWSAARGMAIAIGVGLAVLVPVTMAANVAYLYAIPVYFLIEPDADADRSTWAEACAISGYSLDPVRAGLSRGLERRGETWIRSDDGMQYAILRTPGCTIEPAAIPATPLTPGLHQALPDGSLVFVTLERGTAAQTFWLLRRGAKEPRALQPPQGATESPPLVSDAGDWVAWTRRSATRELSLWIEPLESGDAFAFTHPLLQRATVVPLELDMAAREVTLNRDLSSFVRLRLDGTPSWGPLQADAIAAQDGTFRYVDGQWLSWDAYVEDGRYRLAWLTPAGAGRREVPRGRSITAAALDPRGRYVAISTTTALNIGAIRDTVLVFRTADGSELFRRSLPTYTRSQVAFLGEEYFAYTEVENGVSRTRVLIATPAIR